MNAGVVRAHVWLAWTLVALSGLFVYGAMRFYAASP